MKNPRELLARTLITVTVVSLLFAILSRVSGECCNPIMMVSSIDYAKLTPMIQNRCTGREK